MKLVALNYFSLVFNITTRGVYIRPGLTLALVFFVSFFTFPFPSFLSLNDPFPSVYFFVVLFLHSTGNYKQQRRSSAAYNSLFQLIHSPFFIFVPGINCISHYFLS